MSPRIGDRCVIAPGDRHLAVGFQSICVTKVWRRNSKSMWAWKSAPLFPINRRHQGLATAGMKTPPWALLVFPINRRHQGLATSNLAPLLLIARCGFQSIGVTKDWRPPWQGVWLRPTFGLFPINRRHQGLATDKAVAVLAHRVEVSNQ